MPIQECTLPSGQKGWKWGSSGTCYLDKGRAEKQAAAAHANGFVGDALVFDRATVRTIDHDGRLHLAITNISKANVCEYYGKEIPDWDLLGLDSEKIYQMLRDPEELEAAASTFNNIPLLSDHIPVTPDLPQKEYVVGSTGTDAVFQAPYLRNSLVVWDAEAIAGIDSCEQKELSCSYRYDPDMTPGTYQGIRYDGVMRNIRGNHVALVAAGRAGPDVVVGDSQLCEKELSMKKPLLSRKAMLAKGALMATLPAMLAADSKLDLNKILATVASDNWKKAKPQIASAIKPHLAKDADLDAVIKLLDTLDGNKDDDDKEELSDAIDAEGLSDEEEAQYQALSKRRKPEAKAEDDKDDKDMPAPKDVTKGEGKPAMDKKAMDSAIAAAAKQAEDSAIKRMRDIGEAERIVRPYVGEIVAQDSADAVYKVALDSLGVNVEGVHPSAYRAVLEAQPKPGAQHTHMVMDAKVAQTFAEKFPQVARVRTGY